MECISAVQMSSAQFIHGNNRTLEKTQGWKASLVISHSWGKIIATTVKVKAKEATSVSVKNY